jgi:hypothetical protein
MNTIEHEGWFANLNGPRRAAVYAIANAGQLMPHLMSAVRDERWDHAANLLRDSDWAKRNPERARAMARALETGERQE